ncbi:uncharacterized protein RHOBADRAFT_54068 [Rhodotorula graminis WP1]|uniref:Aminotransferase class I/classII large domain-containing protein n=1 Tax=Rhodotorula graminis (strain WP1) TaxID=578459 RepID=A0A194S0T4_RHOGW|nr:uncharacterized protein RHOBADRAFT_54068 [Rhodotorula graminis WP1]KPV74217.1 hypothetical protein RHOBADRAFT_54068 [Rhodotorula graminis WP1]
MSTYCDSIPTLSAPPVLSERGQRALVRPPLLCCSLFECQYSTLNTSGLINLGVAENSLCVEWLADFFKRNISLEYSDFTYGTALTGSHRLFAALRHLFSTYFAAHRPVEPSHVLCGGGCSAILDSLASVLADPGDVILIALPAYPGFAASFGCRSGVEVVGVRLEPGEEASPSALDRFERAYVECAEQGKKVRAVVVCNPHNPLGFCYPRATLVAYCRWAEARQLHLISDEIYALSTYATADDPCPTPFTSLLALDPLAEAGCSPSRIHVVYGASKDFGCNGLRLGVLVSQANPDVHVAIESSALLIKVSSAADALLASLLLSPSLPDFVALNQSRLAAAYARVTSFLREHGVPYRPAHAGHFVWVDLRAWLEGGGSEGPSELEKEATLARMLWSHGVNLGRGSAYGGTPGWFRLTFTVRTDFFEAGLERLSRALEGRARKGEDVEVTLREVEGVGEVCTSLVAAA